MATYYNSSVAGEAIAGDAIAAVVPKVVTLSTGFSLNLIRGTLGVETSSTLGLTGYLLTLSRGTIEANLSAVVVTPGHDILLSRGDIIAAIPLHATVDLHGNLLRIVQNPISVTKEQVYHTPHFVTFVLQMFKTLLP